MADVDLYSGLSPLPSLAGGYRMGVGSGANAGGYAPVSWFAYRDASANYIVGGPLSCAAGTAALPSISFTGDLNTGLYRPAADTLGWSLGGTERMRLTVTGLGLGKTPAAKLDILETNAGSRLLGSFENSAAGDAWIALKGGDYTGNLRAFGSTYATAPLQNFFGLVSQAGKNVGLLADTGDVRLFAGTFGTERFRVESGGTVRPGADNTQTLGAPASRWSVVYAGTGTINTSDARDKTWRGALTAAELAAAKRIAAELGFYQLNDSIAVKGAEHARYHVGVRAQAVWAIMADEGLVDPLDEDQCPGATPYAFLCWDDWEELTEPEFEDVEIPAVIDDQTGEEIEPARTERQPTGQMIVVREARARFGIRECQLALFLIAAQEARLAALEALL